MLQWAGDSNMLAVHLRLDGVGAAPLLRRALRDVRDRAARSDERWRTVAIAGMLSANGEAVALVIHPDLRRSEVERSLRRRWADAAFPPPPGDRDFLSSVDEAVFLARARRGVEPLRVLILAQRVRPAVQPSSGHHLQEPMPMAFIERSFSEVDSFWPAPRTVGILRP